LGKELINAHILSALKGEASNKVNALAHCISLGANICTAFQGQQRFKLLKAREAAAGP